MVVWTYFAPCGFFSRLVAREFRRGGGGGGGGIELLLVSSNV